MADRVAGGEVLARSLAGWAAYWNAQRTLSAEQERWREHEREWRINLAAQGLLPADWLVADIRSGAKERRDLQSRLNLQRDQAKLAQRKYPYDKPPRRRTGITVEMIGVPAWVEAAWRRQASRVPERRAPVAPVTRSRERRAQARATSPSRGSPDDPPGPKPPLRVIPVRDFPSRTSACPRGAGVTRVHVVFDDRGEVAEYELLPRRRGLQLTHDEDLELRAHCGLAWERRHEPDFRERIAAIIDWHDRRHVRAYERRQRSRAALVQLLRGEQR